MVRIVFDTETTGLDILHGVNQPHSIFNNGSEVLQIGGIFLDDMYRPIRAFCYYCDCLAAESASKALAVHGISLGDIRKYAVNQFLEDIMVKHLPEFLEKDALFIGYNVNFDINLVTQSLRNFCFDFRDIGKITTKIPNNHRWALDTMDYFPKRVKLSSYAKELTPAREQFHKFYDSRLPVETNIPDMLYSDIGRAHNSYFDAIETYLLFMTKIMNKKLFVGGVPSGFL